MALTKVHEANIIALVRSEQQTLSRQLHLVSKLIINLTFSKAILTIKNV